MHYRHLKEILSQHIVQLWYNNFKGNLVDNVKKAVRLNLDSKTIQMLEKLSEKNAGSKSQAARKAIQDAYRREFESE